MVPSRGQQRRRHFPLPVAACRSAAVRSHVQVNQGPRARLFKMALLMSALNQLKSQIKGTVALDWSHAVNVVILLLIRCMFLCLCFIHYTPSATYGRTLAHWTFITLNSYAENTTLHFSCGLLHYCNITTVSCGFASVSYSSTSNSCQVLLKLCTSGSWGEQHWV